MLGQLDPDGEARLILIARSARTLSAWLVLLVLTTPGRAAEDWPCWRGQDGAGIAACELPEQWAPDSPNVRWRTPVPGKGLSSPIVVGERVFVTTAYEALESRWMLDLAGLFLASVAGGLLVAGRLRTAASRKVAPGSVSPESVALGSVALGSVTGASADRLARAAEAATPLAWGAFVLSAASWFGNHFEWMQAGAPCARWRLALGLQCAATLVVLGRALESGRGPASRQLLAALALLAGALVLGRGEVSRHLFFGASALAFLALVGLRIAAPGTSRPALSGELGRALAGAAGPVAVCVAWIAALRPELFWGESTAQHVWRRSTIAAELGLLGAAGLWPRGRVAWLGATLLACLGLVAAAGMPGNEIAISPSPARRIAAALPAAAGVVWLLLRRGEAHRRRTRLCAASSLALVLVAAWLLVRANVWQPRLRMDQLVVCLDRDTGAIRWQQVVFHATAEHLDTFRTSHASPTPASDGERVVVHFGTGTAALTLDGRLLWKCEHPGYVAGSIYGAGSSPVIHGGRVYLIQERERSHEDQPSFVTALELGTGEVLWRIEPREAHSSYGTPLLLPRDEPKELVNATWRGVVAYALDSGEQRWFLELPLEEVVTSPVSDAGRLCVAGGSMMGVTAALDLPGNDLHSPPIERWQTRRATPSCSSPLLFDGRLYTLSEGGVLSAFDAVSGDALWRTRLERGDYYASLLLAGSYLHATSAEGLTSVVRVGEDFELVAVNQLGEGVFASPAAADGQLFMRGTDSVFRIDAD